MSEYRLFAQRIGLIGVTNLLVGISGMVLLPILTKNLPVDDYGIWVQINATIGLFSVLILLGLPYSLVRFLAAGCEREDIQNGFYSIFLAVCFTSFIGAISFLLFSGSLSSMLFNGNLLITRMLPFVIFIEPLNNILLTFFRTFQQIKRYSLFLFIYTYLPIVFIGLLVAFRQGIFGVVLGLIVSRYILFLVMFGLIASEIGLARPNFGRLRDYLAFGIPIIPDKLSGWVLNSSDRYIISQFLGTAFVGYYSPGYLLGNITNSIIGPFTTVLPAALSRHYDLNNMDQVNTLMNFSLKYFLALAIPATLGLSILSKPIIMSLSTPEIAINGYMITPFVAISALMMGVCAIVGNSMILKNKTTLIALIYIISASVNISLNFLFIPHFGILGAAMTTLIGFSIIFVSTMYYSFKLLPFDVDLRFIVKSILASGIMSLLLLAWIPEGMVQILIEVIISAAIYFAALLIMKGISAKEMDFFLGLIKPK